MRRFWAWVRFRAVPITAVCLVAAFSWGQVQTFAVVDRLREEEVRRQVETCVTQNEFRREFPNVLRDISARASAGGGGIDLTALPEFQGVPESVKAYLTALNVALNANPDEDGEDIIIEAAEEYERDFPVRDCKALERRLRARLG